MKLRTFKLIRIAEAEDNTGYQSMVQNKRAKRVVESELADNFSPPKTFSVVVNLDISMASFTTHVLRKTITKNSKWKRIKCLPKIVNAFRYV